MPGSWQQSVARILPAGSDPSTAPPKGAGFLVTIRSDNGGAQPKAIVLTCAHVVLACQSGDIPGRPGRVLVVFDATGEALEGIVDIDSWRAVEAGDIAILRLDGARPQGIDGLPLGSSLTSEGHDFRTLGYPNQSMVQEAGTGTIDAVHRDQAGVRSVQLSTAQVTTGYSGGPIWDEPLRRVVGMVSEIIGPDAYGRGDTIAYATPAEQIIEALPDLRISEECPYRGLEPFTDEDAVARFFFGRDEQVNRIMDRLRHKPSVIAVLGPSGSGKSSLVQAGVIPRLRKEGWYVPPAVRHYDDIEETITRLEALREPGRTLIVLDQFEEALPSAGSGKHSDREQAVGDRKRKLLSSLAGLVEQPATTVMIVMRNDFYSQFVKEAPEPLRATALANLVEIPAGLTRDDIMNIIVEPAELVGLRFEPGLAERIADDAQAVAADQGDASYGVVLPLLEFALTRLWDLRELPYLTLAGYMTIGGVVDGLTKWADEALRELSSGPVNLEPVVRQVMVELVHFGNVASGEPDSRKTVTVDKLKDDIDATSVDEVVTALENKRLLIPGGGADGAPRWVQLAHDTLIRRWKKLGGWLNEVRALKLWEQAMLPRADRWKAGSGALLRNGELAEASRWLDERSGLLEPPLPAWIEASLAARQEEERADRAARQRLQLLASIMAVLALLFLGASFFAYQNYLEADHEVTLNRIQGLLTQANLAQDRGADEQSALLAYEAWRLDEDHELPGPVGMALQESIGSPSFSTLSADGTTQAQSIAYSSDGRTMAVARDDGSLEVARDNSPIICTPPPAADGTIQPLRAIRAVLNTDGNVLAIGSRDGYVHLWRLSDKSCAYDQSLAGPGGLVAAVALGTDSDTLTIAMGSCLTESTGPAAPFLGRAPLCREGGARVRVWALGDQPELVADQPIDGKYACALAIDSDRQRFAATGCGEIVSTTPVCSPDPGSIALWSLGDIDAKPDCLPGTPGEVRALAFDPCEGLLASGGVDPTIRFWDPTAMTVTRTLDGHTEAIRGLAFSRDCAFLGSASEDGDVGIWHLPVESPVIEVLGTSTQWVRTIAFGGANGLDLSAEWPGGRVRTWHLGDSGPAPGELHGHTAYIRALAFSPREGDRRLASVAEDGTLRLWDLDRPWAPPVQPGFGDSSPPTRMSAVAFSYDGRLVAASDSSGRVWVWDVAAPERPLASRATRRRSDVVVAFHPHGYELVVGTRSGNIQLWELTRTSPPALEPVGDPIRMQPEGAITALAFSPSGDTVATGNEDGAITIRPLGSDGIATTPEYTLDGGSLVNALAYSPDGTTLASGGDDGLVRLWTVEASYQEMPSLAGHEHEVRSLAFTPDSAILASGSVDHTIRLWSIERPDESPVIIFGLSEWVRALAISPDGEVLAAAATEGRIRLVVPDSDTLAARVCEHVTRNLTESEWTEIVGAGSNYRPTCPGIEPSRPSSTG